MRLTETEIKQIIKEEINNLINEEEIDEKLFSALKDFGKGLLRKASDVMSGKPSPNASAGVGRAFARYKVPQKQPEEPEQEVKPTTSIVRRPSTAVSTDIRDTDSETQQTKPGVAYARMEPRLSLPSGEKPSEREFEPFGSLPPPVEIKKQLLLSEPNKIGVVDEVGELLADTQGEAYRLLFSERTQAFKSSDFFKNLAPQQQSQADTYINTVLKHLISTERVLKNPTFTSVAENLSEETVPSVRQIEKDTGVFDSYVVRSLIHSIKQKFNYIPNVIIEFVVNSLHEEGRLAISRRMYNSLKHTEDPRLKTLKAPASPIQESKSYNDFYKNWKKLAGIF